MNISHSFAASPHQPTTPELLSALHARGITYLMGGAQATPAATPVRPLSDAELLATLAASQEPRIADALVGLLLLHPALAALLPWKAPSHGAARGVRERSLTRALAALYLQRQWTTLLNLALGPGHAWLAEEPFRAIWRARHLPPPWVGDGAPGLAALAAWERRATGLAANYADDWMNQAQHLIRSGLRGAVGATSSRIPSPYAVVALTPKSSMPEALSYADEQGAQTISMRQPVDKSSIEAFLRELGRRVKQPGKLYLTGGAALVHAGIRGNGATTADIDMKLDAANEAETQEALRQLKNELDIDLELAWPGDFIPTPPSWEASSRYVGRYGALDVFYLDFVTLALAKISRGSERDLRDVEALAQSGDVTREALLEAAEAIRPALGRGHYFNVDPDRFEALLTATIALIWGA